MVPAGVFGRATELAKVTQRKYNLAMAVVMGKDMDSVICDTEATAKECIHWLRQNQVAPMTFFPLDTVRAKVRYQIAHLYRWKQCIPCPPKSMTHVQPT